MLMEAQHMIDFDQRAADFQRHNKDLYELAPVSYITVSAAGEILHLNQMASEMFGSEKEALIKKHFLDFVAESYKERFVRHLQTTLLTLQTQHCEMKLVLPGLQMPFWVKIQSVSAKHPSQPVRICRMALADITEQKNNEFFLKILANNPQQGIIIAQNNAIVYTNEKVVELTGYTQSELQEMVFARQNPFALIYEDDRYKMRAWYNYFNQSPDKPASNSFRIRHKNGQILWISGYIQFVEWDDELAVVHSFIDITKQKKLEERLSQLNAHFNEVVSNISSIVWSADYTPDGRFINSYISPVADELLELPYGTIAHSFEKFYSYVEPEYLALITGIFKKAAKQPDAILTLEYEVKKGNGEIAWFSTSGKIVVQDGTCRAIGYTIDITKQKRTEAKIQEQNFALEQVNQAKDQLFSIISHDLKNPFNNLLGFAEMLHVGFDNYSVEKQKRFVSFIYESGQTIYALLDSLLVWSKIQRNKVEFTPKYFSADELFTEILDLYRLPASQKGIVLQTQVDENTTILADRYMLHTILRNLVSNAVKFTDKNGKITITHRKAGTTNRISVADTGVGLSQQMIDKLENTQTSHSTIGTNKEQGNGLGLLITKEFVQKHDGTMQISSEVGKGTTFTIEFDESIIDQRS